MAKRYTSTITIDCWKEHACAGCGSVYAYRFTRKVKGTSNTAEKAVAAARKTAERVRTRDTDVHPCPSCGLVQPDMIGSRRAKQHKIASWLGLIACVVVLFICAAHGIQANILVWAALAIMFAALAWHWLTDAINPNRDVQANRRRAQSLVQNGLLRTPETREATPAVGTDAAPGGAGHRLAMLGILAAVVLAPGAEMLRSARGWPLNSELYPPVVGPGDRTQYYMPDSITTVKGYWRGEGNATLRLINSQGAASGASAVVPIETNQSDWGTRIEDVKSEEKAQTVHPWVKMTLPMQLPSEPAMAGKTATCEILLITAYPQAFGEHQFQTRSARLQKSIDIHLASPLAGQTYETLWWVCVGGASALLFVCGLVLAGSARAHEKLALPNTTHPIVAA